MKAIGGNRCFFCRKETPKHFEVQWDETNNWVENPDGKNLIHLHLCPVCAIRLGQRLITDGAKIAKKDEDFTSLVEGTYLMVDYALKNYRRKE